MAQLSNNYESTVILTLKNGEESVNELVEKFKALIEANGELTKEDIWGKRKLAYAIEDETEGFYAHFVYTAKPDFPAEFDRIAKITEGVLRFLTVVHTAE